VRVCRLATAIFSISAVRLWMSAAMVSNLPPASLTCATFSLTSACCSFVRSNAVWICAELLLMMPLICWAADSDSSASFLTSSATMAKPRPCSPARAASIAALSASSFVCPAIFVMTSLMSAIRFDPS
jgi:hypothetical protein